ncbi:hypothetical protein PSC74_12445 [Aeromonas hydrophila]|uniref:hypothetical protein n=1 Tax=Aeromonas hydrophila TaxID=644 RepID=UPI00235EFF3D|nr:hypothetical protein [Aeromonas hydrophila]WDA22870.1 hypothetical protein PSC74_12445 [Aeromonas hydrophila]WES92932.1 hypothetical protein PY368_21130 [Aeromonas hydrophila]
MMEALKVMTYFKVSLSTHNWDRAFFIVDITLASAAKPSANTLPPSPVSSPVRPPCALRAQTLARFTTDAFIKKCSLIRIIKTK